MRRAGLSSIFVLQASFKSVLTQSRDRMSAAQLHPDLRHPSCRILTVEAVAMAVAVSVTVVSEPVVSSVVVGLSLSLPLGNMDGSGGVGDVAAGTSVSSSYGGDGSRGSSNGGQRGRRRYTGVAGDHWVPNSVDNRAMVGVAHNRGNMARVDTVVGFSLTLSVAVDTATVAETQSPVSTVVATKTIAAVAVVGISLRFGFPLAVDTVRSETVSPVATVAATKTIVGIGIGLGFSGGEGRKGKCQDSLHLS